MENIRKYFEYLDSPELNEDEMYIKADKCIDEVTNKMLSMSENNQKAYCRVILDFIWGYVYGCDLGTPLDNIEKYDLLSHDDHTGRREAMWFLNSLCLLFRNFGIDMNKESINMGYSKISKYETNGEQEYNRQRLNRKKAATAKTTEQVDVIRTLLKSAEVEYSSDVNLAKFISWLCGGSADSIRNNGLVPNIGYENEEVLKEKFALIGIEYEKGKIKQRISNL